MDPRPCFLGSNKAKIDVNCFFQKPFIESSAPELQIEAAFLCQDDSGFPGKTGTFILFNFLKYLFICSQSLREYIDPEEYSFVLGIQSSSNLCKSARAHTQSLKLSHCCCPLSCPPLGQGIFPPPAYLILLFFLS